MNFKENLPLKAQINIDAKIGARFKFIKSKLNNENSEEKVFESEWVDNLVTDWGLNQLSTSNSNQFSQVVVGSSSTPPDVSQTTLESKIAATINISPIVQPDNVVQTATSPIYVGLKRSYRFAAGVATGIIAEVGLSPNGTNVFNRALVKDANGNPTTITVLSDEILDVLCEVRIYFSDTLSGSFPLKDKIGNTLRVVNYTGKPTLQASPSMYSFFIAKMSFQRSTSGLLVYTGGLSSGYFSNPSGTQISTNSDDVTFTTSYPTSRQVLTTVKIGASIANATHKSLVFKIYGLSSGVMGYQIEFDQGIVKTGSETLQYNFGLTWDRYVA